MTNSNPQTNPTTGQPYAACQTAGGWLPTLADGSCAAGQTRVQFPDLNSMQRAIEGLTGSERQSSSVPGPPNIVTGNNSPGQFIGNAAGGAVSGLAGNLAGIGGFLHTGLQHLTDPAFWKGTGLILAGGLVLIAGFLMWSGIGQATIEGTGPAQAYRRAQSGGVQNVRRKEADDGE